MRFRHTLAAVAFLLISLAPAMAQFVEGDPGGAKLGQSQTQKWRCGMVVTAVGGACKGIVGYAPVPIEWPEQQVQVLEEDVSPGVKISYQIVDGTAKVMTVKIPHLEAGREARAVVTFEIRRSVMLPPEDTDAFLLPDMSKLDRAVRPFLTPSPKIESTNARIRELAKKIGGEKNRAWDRVEAIYDWVREHVKYQNGPLKGALAALKDGTGDCEELTSLFIAMCRAANIPARTVWVPGHCYPEFYLIDKKGDGH
jgi:transglutaminase-like putative cysteine protease